LPPKINPGDFNAVKQILDDSAVDGLEEAGFLADYFLSNIKLLLMIIACIFGCFGQFAKIPFPGDRVTLGSFVVM
jgi:hypothetical protein